jgi:acetyl esterase/lipase
MSASRPSQDLCPQGAGAAARTRPSATFGRRRLLGLAGALVAPELLAQEALPRALRPAWTSAPTLPLWPDAPPGGGGFTPQPLPADWPPVFVRNIERPALHVFRPARPDGRALLVIPGGAYQFVSVDNEGVDVAERVTELGVTVFVLTYRLPGEGWVRRSDVPLQDAQRAMRVIRARSARFGVDPDRVAALGFSAGGHVTATLATRHSERVNVDVDTVDRVSARPLGIGLVYPVVTMQKQWTHELSRNLLLGTMPTAAEIERSSAELHVGAATPPLFIAHALDDDAVPAENSLRLMTATRAAGRPVEAHLFQEGRHAFGIGRPGTPSAHWIELFDAWWQRLGSGSA